MNDSHALSLEEQEEKTWAITFEDINKEVETREEKGIRAWDLGFLQNLWGKRLIDHTSASARQKERGRGFRMGPEGAGQPGVK